MEEKKIDPIEQLREELRNGRVRQTGESLDGDFGISHQEARGSVQVVLRESNGDGPVDNTAPGARGSVEKKPVRIGRAGRRHGPDNSGIAQGDYGATRTRRAGGLETDEPIPQRNTIEPELVVNTIKEEPKRPVGRPPKPETLKARADEKSKEAVFPWFKESKTLSKDEVKSLYEPLINALIDDLGYVDQYLWYRTNDISQTPIWSDISREEAETLARIMLRRGERSASAATMVRAVVNGNDYIDAAVIVVPRVIKTADVMQKSRKPKKGKSA